ncbi:hypothetical protein EYD45_12585 [Hyunsoonleella flava]|uniref:Uncharacterized protein n=1 Tax=Hyunsoonleella flava TaxID=2527939 RepID=A0A4Q9FCQ2_9FLAO|nr:hypothetical protein [Hyunsoonleella flava]TBN01860.1 hypothetical protein EYD45_12585 [Hyunsoonleella flava]
MNKRVFWFYGALLVSIIVLVLLFTRSSVLTIALDKNSTIPLGTFITWAGIISLPLALYWGIYNLRKPSLRFHKFLALLLKVVLVISLLWVPISYGLAGNLSFTFSETTTFQGGQLAMRIFWILSYGIAIGTISIVLLYWISLVFKKNQ